MSDKAKSAPAKSAHGETERARRERRLADALRANLGRRKAQARARADETSPEGGGGDSGDREPGGPKIRSALER